MADLTRRGFVGSLSAVAAATSISAQQGGSVPLQEKRTGHASIKITDLKCAIIGQNPVVRVVTDQGISGYGEAEGVKNYLKPMVLFYKQYLLGEDPTDVQRVMLKIRRMGAFKPWGAAGAPSRSLCGTSPGRWLVSRFISCWVERFATAFVPTMEPCVSPCTVKPPLIMPRTRRRSRSQRKASL